MKNKYYNKRVTVDGIEFDSKKEANRYEELKMLEKAGVIKNIELQKKFELQPKYVNNKGKKIRPITYKADFYYYDNHLERYIVEDTKGYRTEVYKLKKKILEYVYPNLTIDEV